MSTPAAISWLAWVCRRLEGHIDTHQLGRARPGLGEAVRAPEALVVALTDGIELSDDRLPVIRAKAYALSFARRGR